VDNPHLSEASGGQSEVTEEYSAGGTERQDNAVPIGTDVLRTSYTTPSRSLRSLN